MQLKFSHCYIKNDSLFQKKLFRLFSKTGLEGDVIPFMIGRNVPLFILKNLWKDKYAHYFKTNTRFSFAVAEQNWRGRIGNIKSQLNPGQNYCLDFDKNHVIDCDVIIVVAHCKNDRIALALVDDFSGTNWQKRKEPGLILTGSDGNDIHHSHVGGRIDLEKDKVRIITREEYSAFARYIPWLELSSLAILGCALLNHNGIILDSNMKDKIQSILLYRNEHSTLKKAFVIGRRLLYSVFDKVEENQLQLHPFWKYPLMMLK